MMKKMLLFVIILFATFGYRSSGMALEIEVDKEGGVSYRVISVDGISSQDSESEELKEIEESMKQMLEEVKRLERELQKKFKKELWPIIRQEMERLKKWLRELQPEDEETKPQKVRIRKEGLDEIVRASLVSTTV
jgi:peptidoglycan hydrolase CwlO-like protein